MSDKEPIIHGVLHGWPLCGFTNKVPGEWPEGHAHVEGDVLAMTCPDCIDEVVERISAAIIETDRCVSCGKDTGIPQDCPTHDPRRSGRYIEGSGQLCERCEKGTFTDWSHVPTWGK